MNPINWARVNLIRPVDTSALDHLPCQSSTITPPSEIISQNDFSAPKQYNRKIHAWPSVLYLIFIKRRNTHGLVTRLWLLRSDNWSHSSHKLLIYVESCSSDRGLVCLRRAHWWLDASAQSRRFPCLKQTNHQQAFKVCICNAVSAIRSLFFNYIYIDHFNLLFTSCLWILSYSYLDPFLTSVWITGLNLLSWALTNWNWNI